MPKIVDREQRRAEIADAVFALIERGGIEEASLRNVAAQAGLNIGSVRHYVDGHEGMLIEAVRLMAARITARIEAHAASAPTTDDRRLLREWAVDMLEELLPLDEQRRREVVVWLAFCERSRVVPALREEARVLMDGSRIMAHVMLEHSGLRDGALELASEALARVVDGLAIALLHDPGRLTREQIRALLGGQLAACLTWPER